MKYELGIYTKNIQKLNYGITSMRHTCGNIAWQ